MLLYEGLFSETVTSVSAKKVGETIFWGGASYTHQFSNWARDVLDVELKASNTYYLFTEITGGEANESTCKFIVKSNGSMIADKSIIASGFLEIFQ